MEPFSPSEEAMKLHRKMMEKGFTLFWSRIISRPACQITLWRLGREEIVIHDYGSDDGESCRVFLAIGDADSSFVAMAIEKIASLVRDSPTLH